MDVGAEAFAALLRAEGFQEVETRDGTPGRVNPPHAHDYDVRALVHGGEITLTTGGASRTYRAGEEFTMTRGCEHAERIGEQGLRYTVGRRR
jgi:quercetin dioxygenase-like cupin family protein